MNGRKRFYIYALCLSSLLTPSAKAGDSESHGGGDGELRNAYYATIDSAALYLARDLGEATPMALSNWLGRWNACEIDNRESAAWLGVSLSEQQCTLKFNEKRWRSLKKHSSRWKESCEVLGRTLLVPQESERCEKLLRAYSIDLGEMGWG